MASIEEIFNATDALDFDDSVRRVKRLAADALRGADENVTILSTENFNHSYLPDFVMKWDNRPVGSDRLVFLRASSYAEEIEEDVRTLADRQPLFVRLSEFREYDSPVGEAVEALDRSAGEAQSLVTSIPAIGFLDDSPRTGRMLSSFVMRGGRGVVEDEEAQSLSRQVEDGFAGAMESDRTRTAVAVEAVEGLLNPRATAEFSHLFEAAWISSGASAADFPGGVTSIGENLTPTTLRQLFDIVPESIEDFWQQIGNSIASNSFDGMHLVGEQTRLQLIMRNAAKRLVSNRCNVRRTKRSDQANDPFIWQVEEGTLTLRGGGYQGWLGQVPAAEAGDDEYSIDEAPTLSKLSTRSDDADLTLAEISVQDSGNIVVSFSSVDDRNVATSDLVGRVSDSLGTSVRVTEAVSRVEGKNVYIDYAKGLARPKTSAKVSVPGLFWSGWNLIAEMNDDVRTDLQVALGLDDGSSAGPPAGTGGLAVPTESTAVAQEASAEDEGEG
ncbi:hypothetical protein [Rhodococcoides fascians]|uniref:hypothetical protein n=1 Tax=Rhodococcoides fascians TaxID=1828 RepID=UPI000A6945C3|nr:hypothetical protein [Rhodococcus fascians]